MPRRQLVGKAVTITSFIDLTSSSHLSIMHHFARCWVLVSAVAAVLSSVVATTSNLSLYGVNYNVRCGPDWAPDAKRCKSVVDVNKDLAVVSTITTRVRIYSLSDCNQGDLVLTAAKRYGLKVELGIWVSGDAKVFAKEKIQLIELLKRGRITTSSVTAIHVGSEAIYRNEVTEAQIIGYMMDIKATLTKYQKSIPVTIADIGDVYLAHPGLIDAVDFVSANGFPFWERIPIDGAANQFYTRMKKLMEMTAAKKKDFVISETGWASHGQNAKASVASPQNAAKYLKDFYALARQYQWKYYYFEAFDEPWKNQLDQSKTNTVEANFGIFTSDRVMKREFAALRLTGGTTEDATAGTDSNTASPSPSPRPDCKGK